MGYCAWWQTALLFWWGNVYLPSFHSRAERCQSWVDTQVLLVLPVGRHSFLQTISASLSDGENWSLSTACWLLARQQVREKITGFYVRGEVIVLLLWAWWSQSTVEQVFQGGDSVCCRWENWDAVWHTGPLLSWDRSSELNPSTVWGNRCSVRKSKLPPERPRQVLGKERW